MLLSNIRVAIGNNAARSGVYACCGYTNEDDLFIFLPIVPKNKLAVYLNKWRFQMTPLSKCNSSVAKLYKYTTGDHIPNGQPESVTRCVIIGNVIADIMNRNNGAHVTMNHFVDYCITVQGMRIILDIIA